MRLKFTLTYLLLMIVLFNCEEVENIIDSEEELIDCPSEEVLNVSSRNFDMGFSTWSYGPELSDLKETYGFIENNADIYSEQIDNKIPWSAWMNNTDLPDEFVSNIEFRVSNKIASNKLILSVSLLNTDRSDLIEDYGGFVPSYDQLYDQVIEDAYFNHLSYLIEAFNPDYLVAAMEVNELYEKSIVSWNQYTQLIGNVRERIRVLYPELPISESMTLHNLDASVDSEYIEEMSSYINQNLDFAAISYYPFFKDYHTKSQFQQSFDFLHEAIDIPIGFVETNHLAEDLVIESFNTNITSDVCEQKDYLESLLQNAKDEDYEFIIWWAYRDYDLLWESFPDDVKDIGKIWRDTGLLNEEGEERPAYIIWENTRSI